MSASTALHRVKIIFIAMPVLLLLMFIDAACSAWNEFSGDWAAFKDWLSNEWTNPDP